MTFKFMEITSSVYALVISNISCIYDYQNQYMILINKFVEQKRSHSVELADNGTLPSSPSNGIYLSPENDFRRDSVRSMSIIDDSGMRTRLNIKRNGTLPNLSKG